MPNFELTLGNSSQERPAEGEPKQETADEKLLKQIRDDYKYCLEYWREIRVEAEKDTQYMVGDVWDQEDIGTRANRPCIVPDELSQYTKQANNNLRQNKRDVKVTPRGLGARDKDAERRAAIIRGIENQGDAQAAKTTGFECCVESGMGFWGITLRRTGKGKEVHPALRRIANPFTSLPDPDAKEADFSDSSIWFLTDSMRESAFKRKYPKATKQSFTKQDAEVAPQWIQGDQIVIAEYWTREGSYEKGWKVMQYITNGVEILDRTEWPGSWIPIIAVIGEEKYVATGGKSKRHILSLIRRARPCQKMLAFIASQEAEEFGMAPRSPFIGYKGQFTSMYDEWKTANKIPYAFLEVDIPAGWTGTAAPPLPTRPQFQPNPQAYEMAFERWRRSTQAAVGINPLPTAAQRQNEKSGVALEKIQTAEAVGSFHFIDNYDRALRNEGRQLNELITKVMDSPRHVAGEGPDGEYMLIAASTQAHGAPEMPEDAEDQNDFLITDVGEFDVTISTGPNFQSQREESSSFVDLLVQNLQVLASFLPPQVAAKIMGLGIKLKNLGPIGDEIAKMLIPDDQEQIPPHAQAALGQAQQIIQKLQAELQQLTQEKEGKVVELQGRMEIEKLKGQTQIALKMVELENAREIAEIETKAQDAQERAKLAADLDSKMTVEHHNAAHELGMQKDQQAHEAQLADQQHQQALEQGDQQAANASAQSAQEAEQAQQQTTEQGGQ